MNIDLEAEIRKALRENLVIRLSTERGFGDARRLRVTLEWLDERIDSDWIELEDLQP